MSAIGLGRSDIRDAVALAFDRRQYLSFMYAYFEGGTLCDHLD
jgi:hypothetical protein